MDQTELNTANTPVRCQRKPKCLEAERHGGELPRYLAIERHRWHAAIESHVGAGHHTQASVIQRASNDLKGRSSCRRRKAVVAPLNRLSLPVPDQESVECLIGDGDITSPTDRCLRASQDAFWTAKMAPTGFPAAIDAP